MNLQKEVLGKWVNENGDGGDGNGATRFTLLGTHLIIAQETESGAPRRFAWGWHKHQHRRRHMQVATATATATATTATTTVASAICKCNDNDNDNYKCSWGNKLFSVAMCLTCMLNRNVKAKLPIGGGFFKGFPFGPAVPAGSEKLPLKCRKWKIAVSPLKRRLFQWEYSQGSARNFAKNENCLIKSSKLELEEIFHGKLEVVMGRVMRASEGWLYIKESFKNVYM